MHTLTAINEMAAKTVYSVFFTIKLGSSELQTKSSFEANAVFRDCNFSHKNLTVMREVVS